jgi:hypothetical protein
MVEVLKIGIIISWANILSKCTGKGLLTFGLPAEEPAA